MTTPIYETEAFYDVLQNMDDELLVTVRARTGGPSEPVIFYDGKEHALLKRNDDMFIILDYLHPDVRKLFFDSKTILIAEFKDTGIIREYHVPVKAVDKLPIEDNLLPKD